jgi:prepilin-type N-terminal cleavage/methylation domain-containing protein
MPRADTQQNGFTLIELLVVIAIVAILAGLLMPVLAGARRQARVVTAGCEMRSISMGMTLYADEHKALPPAITYCWGCSSKVDDYNRLPEEYVRWSGEDAPRDIFNAAGRSYKYIAPGPGYANGVETILGVWVNAEFPEPGGLVRPYSDPKTSPVRFALWSVGPGGSVPFDEAMQHPVPPRFWYPNDPRGVVTWIDTPKTHVTSW